MSCTPWSRLIDHSQFASQSGWNWNLKMWLWQLNSIACFFVTKHIETWRMVRECCLWLRLFALCLYNMLSVCHSSKFNQRADKQALLLEIRISCSQNKKTEPQTILTHPPPISRYSSSQRSQRSNSVAKATSSCFSCMVTVVPVGLRGKLRIINFVCSVVVYLVQYSF